MGYISCDPFEPSADSRSGDRKPVRRHAERVVTTLPGRDAPNGNTLLEKLVLESLPRRPHRPIEGRREDRLKPPADDV